MSEGILISTFFSFAKILPSPNTAETEKNIPRAIRRQNWTAAEASAAQDLQQRLLAATISLTFEPSVYVDVVGV